MIYKMNLRYHNYTRSTLCTLHLYCYHRAAYWRVVLLHREVLIYQYQQWNLRGICTVNYEQLARTNKSTEPLGSYPRDYPMITSSSSRQNKYMEPSISDPSRLSTNHEHSCGQKYQGTLQIGSLDTVSIEHCEDKPYIYAKSAYHLQHISRVRKKKPLNAHKIHTCTQKPHKVRKIKSVYVRKSRTMCAKSVQKRTKQPYMYAKVVHKCAQKP